MIFKRIKVHNYRQHHDLDITLDGNLILLVGQNGSGKTNLIGAFQFALVGEQTGFRKEDLLSWGTDEGYVELWFQHNGKDGHVSRALHNTGATFVYGKGDTKESFRGITPVNEALKLLVGIDRDLARQSIFVQQGDLDEVLFTEPRARELAFQRLMGIGDAAKVHKTLGEVLATITVPPNYDEQIADGRRRHAEMQTRFTTLTQQQQQTTAQRNTLPSVVELRQQIATQTTVMGQLQQGIDLLKRCATTQQQISQTEHDLSLLPATTADLGKLDQQLEACRRLLGEAQTWKRLSDDFKAAGEAMMALGSAPCTDADVDQALKAWQAAQQEIDRYAGQIGLHDNLLQTLQRSRLTDVNECPVCGAAITDVASLQTRLQERINTLRGLAQPYQTQITTHRNAYQQQSTTLKTYQQAYQVRLAHFQKADAAVKGATQVSADIEAVNRDIQAIQAEKQVVVQVMTRRSALSAALTAQRNTLTTDQAKLTELTSLVVTYAPNATISDYTEAVARIQQIVDALNASIGEIQKFDQALAGLNGMIQELTAAMQMLDGTIATLELKRSQQQQYRDVITTLTRTRDWFHYNNGPHTMSASVLSELNADVNRFLGNFTAPFTVSPMNDSLGFKCTFTDGRPLPATLPDATTLSGGEKVQLALSFRLASYCMFANKLGILSLDEPTLHLDAANIGCFGELMVQLRKVAQGMGLQIIMATHEDSLKAFADTVIDLSKNTDTNIMKLETQT